jgi:hypothetical protein
VANGIIKWDKAMEEEYNNTRDPILLLKGRNMVGVSAYIKPSMQQIVLLISISLIWFPNIFPKLKGLIILRPWHPWRR